jgi:hypothetical protein
MCPADTLPEPLSVKLCSIFLYNWGFPQNMATGSSITVVKKTRGIRK